MTCRSHLRWLLRFAGFLAVVLLADSAARLGGLAYWQPLVNNQALKVHVLLRDEIDPDVLVLGTSKVNRAVLARSLAAELAAGGTGPVTVFGLGQRGMSLHAQRILLADLLAAGRRPRMVLLEVSPITLNANHGGLTDVLRFYASPAELVRLAPRMRTAGHWRAAGRGLFRGLTCLYLRGWSVLFSDGQQGQLDRIRRCRGFRYLTADEPGARRLDEMPQPERQRLLAGTRDRGRRRYMRDYSIGGEPARGLDEVLRMTGELGIPLVLFTAPVAAEYRQALYGEGARERFLAHVNETAARSGVPFIDLDDGRLGLTGRDFHDFGHLNPRGAETLSRRLARELLRTASAGPEPGPLRCQTGASPVS